jgi:hypothetical protein
MPHARKGRLDILLTIKGENLLGLLRALLPTMDSNSSSLLLK